MTVTATLSEPLGAGGARRSAAVADPSPAGGKPEVSDALKAEAAADPGMQTLLELMPLEITDVKRM